MRPAFVRPLRSGALPAGLLGNRPAALPPGAVAAEILHRADPDVDARQQPAAYGRSVAPALPHAVVTTALDGPPVGIAPGRTDVGLPADLPGLVAVARVGPRIAVGTRLGGLSGRRRGTAARGSRRSGRGLGRGRDAPRRGRSRRPRRGGAPTRSRTASHRRRPTASTNGGTGTRTGASTRTGTRSSTGTRTDTDTGTRTGTRRTDRRGRITRGERQDGDDDGEGAPVAPYQGLRLAAERNVHRELLGGEGALNADQDTQKVEARTSVRKTPKQNGGAESHPAPPSLPLRTRCRGRFRFGRLPS